MPNGDGTIRGTGEKDGPRSGNTASQPQVPKCRRDRRQLPPARAVAGQLWVDPIDGTRMTFIPAGEFTFGAPAGAKHPEGEAALMPQRRVHLDGFWIQVEVVTNETYRRFMDETGYPEPYPWHFRSLADVPVPGQPPWDEMRLSPVPATWDEAKAYCRWAGKALPTEEQWEKAARGTDGRRYPWGNEWPVKRDDASQAAEEEVERMDVSPYGCRGMLQPGEWTASQSRQNQVVVKGHYGVSPNWGIQSLDLDAAGLWYRRLQDRDYAAAYPHWFRCVLTSSNG
jgi:hypothetical protein